MRIGPNETRAHHCDCTMDCTIDEQGNITEHESEKCLTFCHLHDRYCTCHIEEPCDPKGNVFMNMDGKIVAMRK